MFSALRSRLTYPHVVATLALFVALGGSSYAAISVTGKNVKNASLTGKDIKRSSLGTKQVRNGSLLGKDFKSGQLPQGARGPAGPMGAAGPAGAAGPSGAPGTARAYAHVSLDCDALSPFECTIENDAGVSRVTRPTTGLYCVEVPGISSDEVAGVAAPEYVGALTYTDPTVYVARDGGGTCPSPSNYAVYTLETGVVSDDIPFNIVIP